MSQLSGRTTMRLCFDDMQNTLINTGREDADRSRLLIWVFFAVLLATKPFIDLTWKFRFCVVGGVGINLLVIVGICVFIITGYLYFFQNDNKRIFNGRIIWLFLGLNLFTACITVCFYNRNITDVADGLTKLFAAYFIYFIGHQFMENDRDRLQIIGIIWITTVLINVLSIMQYSQGTYDIDVTQGVERFAGFYNDPGTPSYNAVISLVFGTLYVEMLRKQKRQVPLIVHIAFALTVLVATFMLKITLTKNAVVMLVVFLMMWIGLYKRKSYIILPLVIIGGYFIYTINEEVQLRMAAEIEFLSEGTFSMELARPMGSGRVGHWERVLTYYSQDFDLFQKLFGNARSFGAHNQYIAYLMQVGLIGLTLFFAILFRFYGRLFFLYRQSKRPEIYMGIVFLTVFVVCGLTGHPFYYTTMLWYLMILLSFINVHARADTIGRDVTGLHQK